jgi:hypothetical protein
MSRTVSAAARRAFYSPECGETFAVLLTFSGGGLPSPVRITNNFNTRLNETSDDLFYGIVSRGNTFKFIPMTWTDPSDDAQAETTARLELHDVTRQALPNLRGLQGATTCDIEYVLLSDPEQVEVSFPSFEMRGFAYTAEVISIDLSVRSTAAEPFPCHGFTPNYAPGLF